MKGILFLLLIIPLLIRTRMEKLTGVGTSAGSVAVQGDRRLNRLGRAAAVLLCFFERRPALATERGV